MKSYLEGCGVPTTRVGEAEVPRLITAAQVDHMLPNLDRLHPQAIWETEQHTDTQIGLLAYILIPITLDGEAMSYSQRLTPPSTPTTTASADRPFATNWSATKSSATPSTGRGKIW